MPQNEDYGLGEKGSENYFTFALRVASQMK